MAGVETVFVYTGREEVPSTVVHANVRIVASLPARAFRNRKRLRTVSLPEGLRIIGAYAFSGCDSLAGIRLPPSIDEIGDGAFNSCRNLKSVNLPEGLRIIGGWAFKHCGWLESTQLPSSLTSISDGAFHDCGDLSTVLFSEGLQTIGWGAFRRCPSLESIQLPSSVTTVRGYAFQGCTNLTSVLLPEGLLEIGEGAFRGCSSLGNFRFHGLSARMEGITFDPQTEVEVQEKVAGISALAKEGGGGWTEGREHLDQLRGFITYLDLKEATTILELALWKAKLEVRRGERDDGAKEKREERRECRVTCGTEIIVKEVASFFDGTFNTGWW